MSHGIVQQAQLTSQSCHKSTSLELKAMSMLPLASTSTAQHNGTYA